MRFNYYPTHRYRGHDFMEAHSDNTGSVNVSKRILDELRGNRKYRGLLPPSRRICMPETSEENNFAVVKLPESYSDQLEWANIVDLNRTQLDFLTDTCTNAQFHLTSKSSALMQQSSIIPLISILFPQENGTSAPIYAKFPLTVVCFDWFGRRFLLRNERKSK